MAAFEGLNRLKRLQQSPFGSSSALRPTDVSGQVGQQYRRQQEMYNTAMRSLRRQARRGDAGAAIDALGLQRQANQEGFSVGGIRRKEEFDAGIRGRAEALRGAAADRERRIRLDRMLMDEEEQAAQAAMPEQPGFEPPKTKTYAALDILEGWEGDQGTGDAVKFERGEAAAREMGVQNPRSILMGDTRLKYRKTLDDALGKATSPEEIAALRERGKQFGVSEKAFDRRAKWWERNRS